MLRRDRGAHPLSRSRCKTDPTAQTADDLIHALADRLLMRAALFVASIADCKSTSALNPVPLNLTFQYFYTFLLCSGY